MILKRIFSALNAQKVRYLVVGGVASVLYGNPRFTKDLDILVDLSEKNLKKLVAAVKKLKLVPRIPVRSEDLISPTNRSQWIKKKNMLAFTFINPKEPLESIDILISAPISFETAYKRKKDFKSGAVRVPTVSKQDLITMKKKAGRHQDLEDVKVLKAIK